MPSQIAVSDTYDIYYANPDLLTSRPAQPAEYPPGEVRTLRRDATVDDICDFIVEYINSDVMVCHYSNHAHIKLELTPLSGRVCWRTDTL